MKSNSILVFAVVCFVAVFVGGCGANMFGSSFTHKTTAPGMNRTEIRNQGMGTSDTTITENYSGMGYGGGYAAGGIGVGPMGQPGSMVVVPAAPQSYIATDTNLNTIPYVENRTVRELEAQHRALQNLRDIERCRAQGKNCK